MAYDKVVDSSVLDGNLTSIANAIRAKSGVSDDLSFPDGMVNAITAIRIGKSGTTTSPTFDTGLSNIDALYISKQGEVDATGLLAVTYHVNGIGSSYIYCSDYSSGATSYVYVPSESATYLSITGGTVSWTGTDASVFISNATYSWVAIGT